MTTIYLVRHAKSQANETGMFGGITDFPLCKEGLDQAEILSDKITSKNLKIDAIYSSPLKRAIQTITPTATKLGLQIKLEEDLREIYVGEWENKLRADLVKQYPKENEYIYATEHYTGMKGQEETEDVAERMVNILKNIAEANKDKRIIAVSHIVSIRAFLCKILNIPFEKTKESIGKIDNAGIATIEYDNKTKKFKLLKLNQ